MNRNREYLLREITDIKSEIAKLPAGEIQFQKNGKYIKWYVKEKDTVRYIPKSQRLFAEELALKKYLLCRMEELEKELAAVDQYEKQCRRNNRKSASLLLEKDEFQQLLKDRFEIKEERVQQWLQEEYRTNPRNPENLIYKTPAGHMVRSKSELIIATILFMNHIPYRYECELVLGDHVIYPDFTIMHPKTYGIYYLEHFGMMDVPYYIHTACEKIRTYAENGIIPTMNLLTTYETKKQPIDPEYVERMIIDYFLEG